MRRAELGKNRGDTAGEATAAAVRPACPKESEGEAQQEHPFAGRALVGRLGLHAGCSGGGALPRQGRPPPPCGQDTWLPDWLPRSRRSPSCGQDTWLPDWLSSCNPFDDDGAQDDFLPDHLPEHEDEVDPFAEPGGVRKMKKRKRGRKKMKARDLKRKVDRRRRRAAAAQRKRDDDEREEEAEEGQP